MTDNVAITAGSGTTIGTDDVAGTHFQRVKLVDGTLDSTAAIAGDATNGLDVDVTRQPSVTSATTSQVASSASTGTLKASNSARNGLSIFNASTAILYVKLGATASLTSYAVQIPAGGYWELPTGRAIYTGVVDGIWASANGNAYVTEW